MIETKKEENNEKKNALLFDKLFEQLLHSI